MSQWSLNLDPVERREYLTRQEFQEDYFKTKKPVVMRNFSAHWPARTKWSFDYFKRRFPDVLVPVYEGSFAESGKSYTSADNKMPFGEYLDLIAHQPTQLRMFLFNIFKYIPALCEDFDYPDIIDKYDKKRPFMFFGGATSWVDLHYDLDLPHIFLTQFHGKKRVILFAPEYSDLLYRNPFTVSTNVDLGNPDFVRFPKLLEAKGYECEISDGDTLYMPSGFWHYVYYIEGGFALTLRARPLSVSRLVLATLKIFNLLVVDYNISRVLGPKRWCDIKERMAIRRAERHKQK